MDDVITLQSKQLNSHVLNIIKKCLSKMKQQFLTLGSKYASDPETSARLTNLQQNVHKAVIKFGNKGDLDSLNDIAVLLSELFMLKGMTSISDLYGDKQHYYWSVACGPVTDWLNSVSDINPAQFRLSFDDHADREQYVKSNSVLLGWYLLPSFIDLSKFLPTFLTIPEEVVYRNIRRIKHPKQQDTDYDRIITIEDSPFLTGLKNRLLKTIDSLPDPAGQYISMFNRIVANAVYPSIRITAARRCAQICQQVIREFSDSLLTLPVYKNSFNDAYRLWTPWDFNFVDFSRIAYKQTTSVYLPEPGQIKWLSDDHQRMVSYALISRVIPQNYQWNLGVLTMWKNHYRTPEERLELVNEWRQ
ncbi:hypothetical protein [Photorhabdus heterorhabditis]|uniref:Uncharacterized protein n=1 Tax=Photorhabdus heterorhabditis TaxID=880156 RepID=A0A5B0WHC6_9GAMM|nr:hypothetical protein [Photorhabdus heterorhabditis]KAA1186430.1 hypothetical protein F0L16_13945 [Photorhabdus heterorhabditis]MBS9441199.1 hypothetical protein [Photorhabdus heterorhabditis]